MTYGAIDGYSRTITYLKCSDNNRASTVLSEFISAVHVHGLPERIRTDQGGGGGEMLVYGGTWQNNMVRQLLLSLVPRPTMSASSVCKSTQSKSRFHHQTCSKLTSTAPFSHTVSWQRLLNVIRYPARGSHGTRARTPSTHVRRS